ncbi:hypothetical protein FOA19_09770 [Rufibacter hautae]|uniref:Uncharacterized protein n=1 Tax=Rufibacter hautae TaxID=2595005 RepID=A0A5B6TEI2_9BACT|nr:hypothetical protein FOA19_09770 [Rufibacter hautae]
MKQPSLCTHENYGPTPAQADYTFHLNRSKEIPKPVSSLLSQKQPVNAKLCINNLEWLSPVAHKIPPERLSSYNITKALHHS